ncbi:hypothetical protein BCV69DRAFT_282193 [Microstroma glucosiphilum]|uniref:Uncharacterized protein n=1 Tax=Pseudomicrostroma glucosiphilum TaxID=1684307 RepID=A0A316U893_9BASI|nr:hypothetical protein BCV69DRAFT_282193 [Pseudomicrostroma glucosiphilum]PWN21470.1 hypothetical protein BCV69DRAFT_282193 [Pseudomicrostroma glucosiphilum]
MSPLKSQTSASLLRQVPSSLPAAASRSGSRFVHTLRLPPAPPSTRLVGRSAAPSKLLSASTKPRSAFVRTYSSSGKAIRDPSHPKGLYFHPFSSTEYAISLLPSSPPSETHLSVLGHITLPSASTDPITFARENPDELVVNKVFWSLLHETLKEDVVRGQKDENLIQEADLRDAGWAHLADERQLLMPGRIPTPDAIIASVSFTDCTIAPDSYEINDTYRPVTREEGFIVLRDVWLEALKARLAKST